MKRFFSLKPNSISAPTKQWKPTIGLEVHAQINSKSKLFSRAAAGRASGVEMALDPNLNVSCFDAALPGTLPVLNKSCAMAGVKSALALNCHLNMVSKFDRKHYFYFDLPAGYQITQQRQPLGVDGYLDFYIYSPEVVAYKKRSEIVQLQLEQDSGKSIHDPTNSATFVDLSRAGSPLIEIVFKPDLESGLEAACLIRALGHLLNLLGVCRGRMEMGELRVDANVSVGEPGGPLGTRTEIKNVNSVKFVQKAIDFEINRQIMELNMGNAIVNQTMHYDYRKGVTYPTRDKELFHDYRFLPEPNLPALRLYDDSTHLPPSNLPRSQVINVKADFDSFSISQMHLGLVESWMAAGSDPNWALLILFDEDLLRFVETCISEHDLSANLAVRFCWNELRACLKARKIKFFNMQMPTKDFATIVELYEKDLITSTGVSKLFNLAFDERNLAFEQLVESNDWGRMLDAGYIREQCEKIFSENPNLCQKYYRANSGVKRERLKEQLIEQVGVRIEPSTASMIFDELFEAGKAAE